MEASMCALAAAAFLVSVCTHTGKLRTTLFTLGLIVLGWGLASAVLAGAVHRPVLPYQTQPHGPLGYLNNVCRAFQGRLQDLGAAFSSALWYALPAIGFQVGRAVQWIAILPTKVG